MDSKDCLKAILCKMQGQNHFDFKFKSYWNKKRFKSLLLFRNRSKIYHLHFFHNTVNKDEKGGKIKRDIKYLCSIKWKGGGAKTKALVHNMSHSVRRIRKQK